MQILNVTVRHLYVSEGHNFRGHHGRDPDSYLMTELAIAQCVAGKGIEGDRYFGYQDDYKGQITFFDWDVYRNLCTALHIHDRPPSVLRRNVILEGVDLNALIGVRFEIQGVTFEGSEECKPCYWMDRAFGPGAEAAMQGRGGLRARITSTGVLRQSP